MRKLISVLVAGVCAASTLAADKRPNVIFICTDQQHAGMLSCAGNPWLKTPALDSLAANGARFERAYSVNPVCVPSRTGMITGYTPSRFKLQHNGELDTTRIPAEVQQQTMGWLFRNAGYETAYGGKTHVPGKILDYGFDAMLTGDPRGGLADECAAFIKKPHAKPFLLFASFINPHDICYMASNDFAQSKAADKPMKKGKAAKPENEASRYLAKAMQRPPGVSEAEFFAKYCPPVPANLEPQVGAPEAIQKSISPGEGESFRQHAFDSWDVQKWRLHRWAYCRLTEQADGEIGRVLQALRAAGLEENTVIVFSSDHGDMDGSHRLEHKSTFYEEAARVPFIVSYKGVTKPGLVDTNHLVSSGMDLIPTMCDFAGIKPPAALLGRSVRALAEGRGAPEWRPYVASETHYGRMIRSGHYKYCVYETGKQREQLVDLEKDPGEMKNLAADPAYADVLKQHRQFMREWVEANHDTIAAAYLVK
ncbi:MAG: sulfatase-like hydrolase/transferase [Verrucomicrobia bacterium]|nr:sulfatase-like hydrolase/transferase [Verrucomicrobiota bacterium]